MPVSVRLIVTILILIAATLLNRLNLEWRPLPRPFQRSPTTMMGVVDPSFSAERCADLHNRLLQKAIVNEPSAMVERNLIARILDASLEVAEFSIPKAVLPTVFTNWQFSQLLTVSAVQYYYFAVPVFYSFLKGN